MTAAQQPDNSSPPPPVKRSLRRPLLLIGCGVILAALVLVVSLNLDRGKFADETGQGGENETIEPDLLAQVGGERPGGRGGIQITDDRGELAQQYRYTHLDPTPEGMGPGWIAMTEPELEVYLPDGDVVVLTGDSALAHRPSRAIESGTLTGNVLIRMYENIAGDIVDPRVDEPSMALRTAEARFDNLVGEVVCDGDLLLETRAAEFKGRELLLRINDRDDIIQLLRVAKVEYVRLARRDREAGSASAAGSPARPAPSGAAGASAGGGRKPQGRKRENRRAVPGMAMNGAQFYRLTLHDNVRIRQGESDDARIVTGNELGIIFTTKSVGLGGMLARRVRPADRLIDVAPPHLDALVQGPRRMEEILYAVVLASFQDESLGIAPASSADDTYVTCDGPLTMEPMEEPDPRLASPEDALVELLGDPVRMVDPAESAEATCARLEYRTRDGRIELIGSESHELHVASPQLDATGERFWLNESGGTGGFSGAGSMQFLRPRDELAEAGPSIHATTGERLSLAWRDRVDLEFDDAGSPGELGALSKAVFAGAVHAHSDELALSETTGSDILAPGESTAGDLRSERLTVAFEPDEVDRIRPAWMIAAGDVEITDARQALWTQSLDVKFAPAVTEDGASAIEIAEIIADGDVQMLLADGQRVFARRMEFDGRTRSGTLTGSNIRLVDGANLIDQATHITVDDEAKTYTLDSGGRFWRFDRPLLPAVDGPLSPDLLEGVFDRREDLRITWTDRVEIRPADGETGAGTQTAVFKGDVQVVSPRLKLTHADEMAVAFAEDEGGDSSIRAIDATGGIRSRAFSRDDETGEVHEVGDIACRDLHVDVARNERGETVPTRLLATGAVRVTETDQTMWTEALTVTFAGKEASGDDAARAAADGDLVAGDVAVDAITAEGGVTLLLKGGERVFAERLTADVAGESAELFGERVLIVTEEFILDRGRHLVVNKQTGSYEVRGPGEFHAFVEPIQIAAADRTGGPVPIPVIDEETARSLRANWTRSALYTEESEDAGSLDLRGDVHVFAQTLSAPGEPVEIQKNTVDAGALTLQFREAYPEDGGEPARELTSFIARGDAKLENRTWRTVDESDQARVFYIAAQHIDYDLLTQEALVDGDGKLVIRDEWIDETEAEPEAEGGLAGGFAAKGVTLFRWQETLQMTREVDDRFLISMTGNVECLHSDPDGRASSLTGQEIQATVQRVGAGDAQADALSFGGEMDLKRLYGRGGVFVRTPDHDVACETFEYNPMTKIAEISAAPGGFISVMTPGSPYATRAERAVWDMEKGVISVTRGAGAGAP